jgi:hypothetical protein
MRTNSDITLYSRSIVAGAESWARSVIADVAWEDRRAATARLGAVLQGDTIAIYIPEERGAVVNIGDTVVKGQVTDIIGPTFTLTDLKAKYPNRTCVVRSVDTMDQGSERMHHLQIGAN